MRRGGLGAAGVARRRQENRRMERIGESLEAVRLETVKEQCDTFKERLQEFATKYRSKIESDATFRAQFLGMCQSVGVDPLQSTKSVFGSMLGLGRFYAELGVQILTLCLATREDNGGLLDMDDCLAMLQNVRATSSDAISREDVTKAISELSVLGAGGVSIVWGERGKTFISSVPDAFNADQTSAISLIVSQGGHISLTELARQLDWTAERTDNASSSLLREGLVWLDVDPSTQERVVQQRHCEQHSMSSIMQLIDNIESLLTSSLIDILLDNYYCTLTMNGGDTSVEPLLPSIDREEVKLRSCITNLAVIAAPQIISMVLNYIPQTINVFFISRLGDADMLAAVGLANLVFNIGGVSCGYGINQAIETLVSQSRGHGGHHLASVHMAKGMCIGLLLSTILFIVLQFTEVALNFLRQDPVVAKHAMDYVNSASIGIWPAIQYDCIMRFLLCYHHPHVCTWIYAITSALHVLWCYLLVTPSSGLAGAGVAMALTFVGCWVLGILYFVFAMINPSITAIPRDALPRFTRAMFRGWWEYLKIGIPSMITLCSEWWAYEICTLIVGLLQDSAQLAAHVSVCNVSVLMFMMSYGLQTGLSAKIGAAVGSGNLHLARTYCKAAVIMGGGLLIVIEFILITFKMSIVNFYSAPEPEVMVSVYLATLLFPYLGIQEVFDFAQACMQGVFKGLGIQRYAAIVNLCSYYLCMLPLGYLFCIHFELGVFGMWTAFIVSVAAVASSYSIILKRIV
ncbi:hypothetical protein FOZ62_023973 [Perkinsus olseni]|uniref:Uncharacterized protein n=1 Tax=Perkinsus olseni TaxID=32597 RepID=A0A7J6RAI1_PEROL|nr:hypothetical protein FOZ62_023973 [Perkinsus olseni]